MDPNDNWKNLHLSDGTILRYASIDIPTGSPGVYDAVIDPFLVASLPASHQYVNLTELVANETPAGIATGAVFNIGLVPRGSAATCTEPGNVIVPSNWPPLNLTAITGVGGTTTSTRNPAFWWNMPQVTVSNDVVMAGVHIPSGSVHQCFSGLAAGGYETILRDCFVGSGNIITDNSLFAYNSTLFTAHRLTSGVAATIVELWNCYWNGAATAVDWTLSVHGGFINGSLVTTGAARTAVAARITGTVQIGNTGGATINNLSGSGGVWFEILSSTIKQVEARGCFQLLILRGSGHRLDMKVTQDSSPTNPAIQLLSCSDSLIVVDLDSPVAGAQAYTMDAGSNRNTLLLGGSGHANYSVASTDAGTANRVLGNALDTFALGKTLTSAHLLVGSAGNVATDVAVTGDVTISNAGVTTIAAASVTLAKMANLAANSIIGNNTGAGATPIALTAAQVMAFLSGGATADFSMGTHKITAVTDPTAAQDAATKNYVDTLVPGAWTSYTPQIDQGATTNIAKTIDYAKFVQHGKTVTMSLSLTITANGTAAANLAVSAPATPAAGFNMQVGSGLFIDVSAGFSYKVMARWDTATSRFMFSRTDNNTNSAIGNDPNVAVANGDIVRFFAVYEAT